MKGESKRESVVKRLSLSLPKDAYRRRSRFLLTTATTWQQQVIEKTRRRVEITDGRFLPNAADVETLFFYATAR